MKNLKSKLFAFVLTLMLIVPIIPASAETYTGWAFLPFLKYDNLYGGWRYYDENGNMLKDGWELIDGNWYYFYGNGNLAANTFIGGEFYVNGSGALTSDIPEYMQELKTNFPFIWEQQNSDMNESYIIDSNVDVYNYVNEYYNREKEYFNFNLHDTGIIVDNFYIQYFISYSTGNVIQLPHQYMDPIIVRNSGYTVGVYQQQCA